MKVFYLPPTKKQMENYLQKYNRLYPGIKKYKDFSDYDPREFDLGIRIEMEHVDVDSVNKEEAVLISSWIVKAHLYEIRDYYTRLVNMEKEAEIEGTKRI